MKRDKRLKDIGAVGPILSLAGQTGPTVLYYAAHIEYMLHIPHLHIYIPNMYVTNILKSISRG